MAAETDRKACLACDRGPEETPLIVLEYQGSTRWICPQHLPLLIHEPARLAGRLPGAADLRPAEHHD